MSRPSDLNLANDIRPSKQQQKRQYCSLVGRKEKRIKKNSNDRLPTAIQP
jgi:hypothetical protein